MCDCVQLPDNVFKARANPTLDIRIGDAFSLLLILFVDGIVVIGGVVGGFVSWAGRLVMTFSLLLILFVVGIVVVIRGVVGGFASWFGRLVITFFALRMVSMGDVVDANGVAVGNSCPGSFSKSPAFFLFALLSLSMMGVVVTGGVAGGFVTGEKRSLILRRSSALAVYPEGLVMKSTASRWERRVVGMSPCDSCRFSIARMASTNALCTLASTSLVLSELELIGVVGVMVLF